MPYLNARPTAARAAREAAAPHQPQLVRRRRELVTCLASSGSGDQSAGGSAGSSRWCDAADLLTDEGVLPERMRETWRRAKPSAKAQARMLEVLARRSEQVAQLRLGSSMVAAGVKGCGVLAAGWLFHIDVLATVRWDAGDVSTGVLWALPATALAAALALLPAPALAAAAGSASNGDSSSGCSRQAAVFRSVKRMAGNYSLAKSTPLELQFGGGDDSEADSEEKPRRLGQLSLASALQGLGYLREALLQPWDAGVAPPRVKVLNVVEEQLQRVVNELALRGLVATGLGSLIYQGLSSAGTDPKSLLLFLRVFGLVTPQTGLTLAVLLMLAANVPFNALSIRPFVLFTRLSSLDVQVVGGLSTSDWLLRVQPVPPGATSPGAFAATAAAAARLRVREYGAAASGGGQQLLTLQQAEQRMQELLVLITAYSTAAAAATSSSSSSNDSSSAAALQALEAEGAELLAQVVQLTERVSALADEARASSSSRAGLDAAKAVAAKLGAAGKLVMTSLDSLGDREYLAVSVSSPGRRPYNQDSSSSSGSGSSSGSSSGSGGSAPSPPAADDSAAPGSSGQSSAALEFKQRVRQKLAAEAKAADSSSSSSSSSDSSAAPGQRAEPLQQQQDGSDVARLFQRELQLSGSEAGKLSDALSKAWRLGATQMPTPQDALVQPLMLLYTLLVSVAPAGAFVATGGNVAAALSASCVYHALAAAVTNIAAARAQADVQAALGPDWLLLLQPFQRIGNDDDDEDDDSDDDSDDIE